MKAHLKAMLSVIVVTLVLFGLYYFLSSKSDPAIDNKKQTPVSTISLPKTELVLLNGEKLNLKDFSNKVIIFNFWASWCAPCVEEVPSLVSLVKADPNIVVIAVSGDQNKDEIFAFLKSFPGFNKPPIYVVNENKKELVEFFQVDKLPESFIFNAKGEMVKKISGTINWHTKDSIEYFKTLRN